MTDYTWPSWLAPHTNSFYLQPHAVSMRSPFTRQQKVYELSRPLWMIKASFHGMERGLAAKLDAFLARVKGPINRVSLYDWRRPSRTATGALSGGVWSETTFSLGETFLGGEVFEGETPCTNLAATSGATTMTFTGAAANKKIFQAGDYVGGDGRPHIIIEDAWALSDGTVTVTFEPPLSSAVAAAGATINRVRGWFRIDDDGAGANSTDVNGLSQYEISFTEDLS